jgi:hypothetical protein
VQSARRVRFHVHVPESVSLYLAINEGKVLEQMIAGALDQTIAAIEARMETKFRKAGFQGPFAVNEAAKIAGVAWIVFLMLLGRAEPRIGTYGTSIAMNGSVSLCSPRWNSFPKPSPTISSITSSNGF